jgi:hypothetical protein
MPIVKGVDEKPSYLCQNFGTHYCHETRDQLSGAAEHSAAIIQSTDFDRSTVLLFAKTAKRRPVQFLGEIVQWVETARYLGVILDTW